MECFYFVFLINLLFILCVWFFVCVLVHHMCTVPVEARRTASALNG